MIKPVIFAKGEVFHVFNKSIAGFKIFKDDENITRYLESLEYYNNGVSDISFSRFIGINEDYVFSGLLTRKLNEYVRFIAYCIMPDHYHFLVKVLKHKKLSNYLSIVENSYSRYFNLKFKRKGPLWQSRFKAVRIQSDEELLHVSRYIHLNPVTAYLVKKPEEWQWSSYRQFLNDKSLFSDFPISGPSEYQKFVENNIDYQRTLAEIKKHLIA